MSGGAKGTVGILVGMPISGDHFFFMKKKSKQTNILHIDTLSSKRAKEKNAVAV